MKKNSILTILFFVLSIAITVIVVLTLDTKDIVYRPYNKNEVNYILGEFTFDFDSEVNIKDILGESYDEVIDTSELGEKEISVKSKDDKRITYQIRYKVVDREAPLIKGSNTITIDKGSDTNLVNKFLCGDYYDDIPNRYIEGDYDINRIGSYNLTYVGIDSSGNKSTKDFTLKVVKPTKSTSSPVTRKSLTEMTEKYIKDGVKAGIDVSAWQGNINWEKAKNDGVEFAMIRIGYGHNSDNEMVMDKQFTNNIKKAKEAGIPVGVYFYSYARTTNEAREQAKWIVDQLDGEKLELPISLDWENWSGFNTYNVGFKTLNDIAEAFIDEVEKNGYEASLYSSAYYLNHIWKDNYNTWLAYWTNDNDYEKEYTMWQVGIGKVNGIGEVDVDLLYDTVQNKKTP